MLIQTTVRSAHCRISNGYLLNDVIGTEKVTDTTSAVKFFDACRSVLTPPMMTWPFLVYK